MEEFKAMWDGVISIYSLRVTVLGVNFSFMEMFVFFFILSLAVGFVVHLFRS